MILDFEPQIIDTVQLRVIGGNLNRCRDAIGRVSFPQPVTNALVLSI